MFYTKDDIQPAVNATAELFGSQAQYQPSPFMYLAIETPKYGTLWYGDTQLDANTVKERCRTLSKTINEPISAIDLGTGYLVFNSTP